ncbi:MAG TPA: hypothetical protein PKM57_13820 [Kiritimatiellia bacterium]|nr:hypothetical protein [Kiritimatiellia bacterium]HPS07648.1 hypothetical protein [Kiritimatiellia bacterium]
MKTRHRIGLTMILAGAFQAHAALPTSGLVSAGCYAEVIVSGQTNVTGLAVSGTLEKRGAGSLTLTNLYSLPGAVWAREGTVTLAEEGLPDSLPVALQRGLAFWVDANTNVVLSGSATVEKWLDVREVSTNAPYSYMRAEHDYTFYSEGPRSRKPSRVQGNASVNSLRMVDFGTFGATNSNAAWLPWRKADGTRGVLTTIRAVFAVAAFPDSNGFLISDWDYTDAGGETNTVGTGHFWLGTEINARKYFRLFQSTTEAYKGTTYMNGVHVESGTRAPDVLGHVFETLTAAPLTAANFFNGRNIDGYLGTFPHIGGGGLGEVLIYTNALTEAERLSIEGYLQRKWKSGGQVGLHRVEAGATLITAAGAGTTNRIGGISGEGRWRKTGAGGVSLANELSLMYGDICLEEGALIDGGAVRRPNRLFVVPDSGLVVRAETNRWEILSTGVTNALVKSGAGELTVTGFPSSVGSVIVNGGTLRLTQALRDPERSEAVTIYNNSFELFTDHNFHGQWPSASPDLWGFEPAGSGWTYTGNPTASLSPNAAGIYKPDGHTVIWCVKQLAPDGEWVALIKMGGGLATTFTVPSAGCYRLVFLTASRGGGYSNHRYNILVNGQEFAHVRTRRTLFERKEFVLPWLSEGTHALAFQGVNEGPDRGSVLDAVRIEKVDAVPVAGVVTNNGFEVSAALTDVDVGNVNDPGNYSYTFVVTNAGWDFSLSGVHRSGITEDFSPFLSQRFAAEGTRCAFLMQQGVMSTMVHFPTNGMYDLSFLTSARFDWSIKDPANIYYNLHDYRIKLGGEQVGTWVTYKKYFERVTFRLPVITNAPVSKELRFEGINTLTGDRTSLFDDVRVTRLTDGDPMKDSRFELPAGTLANGDTWESGITNTAWTFDLGAGMRNMSGITRNGSAWRCPNAPEGAAMAVLQMEANMSQPLTFAEGGFYTLSFMAAGRMRDYPRYYLHDFRVLFNGEEVGTVQTSDETWRRYAFRLPYVKAGVTNSLVFDGLNSMYNQLGLADDHTSFIDDVRITKQTALKDEAAPGAYRSVAIRLVAGSKLALDFPGQMVFKELWYDGRSYTGTLDASNTAFLTGAGSVYVAPKGTIIRIQ